jgi:hypothetical protein
MTVLAFVSTQARDRAKARAVEASVMRGRHAAPFILTSPGPFAPPTQLRVYHPALSAPQRHRHLSSLMARSACALWSGLATTALAGAAGIAAAMGTDPTSTLTSTLTAAALAAGTGGVAFWHRAGRGAREVAGQLRNTRPGEPVIAHAHLDRLDPATTAALVISARLVDRDGAEGARARQAVWDAARAPRARFSRRR